MFCLDPPLINIPRGQWFCHTCLFGTGGDYGFDEGEIHSLSSFQARDLEFRKRWFEQHPPDRNGPATASDPNDVNVNRYGKVVVSEYDLETEFWRLVQSQHETVEIEYGADVHSTTHGRYDLLRFEGSYIVLYASAKVQCQLPKLTLLTSTPRIHGI